MAKRIAIVTGSNQGIGFEIAKKLAAAGLRTIMATR
jgi:NAD(P)-dependent dehydrogenase (short-subunit alcohol dehydrogenase family)